MRVVVVIMMLLTLSGCVSKDQIDELIHLEKQKVAYQTAEMDYRKEKISLERFDVKTVQGEIGPHIFLVDKENGAVYRNFWSEKDGHSLSPILYASGNIVASNPDAFWESYRNKLEELNQNKAEA